MDQQEIIEHVGRTKYGDGCGVFRHVPSGDIYAYDENTATGSRASGPLHYEDIPLTADALTDLLSNSGDHDDGDWFFDEMQAGHVRDL